MKTYSLNINNKTIKVEAEPDTPMLWVIRDYVGLKGTKFGCGMGLCGACTIHLDGQAIRSCQTPISSVKATSKITTIEGISNNIDHVVQKAWIEEQVPQCGYCQSGQIMSAVALLKSNPNPTDDDIDNYMSGNICRCGTYVRIRKAIHSAANELKSAKNNNKTVKSTR
ncbi:(2Fe-2S)-binding protein [Arcicella lustrica]|uniref:(2Fe-2S)-binding protein n=1 Tax=Arcicella lustrica TaxID=2984196 RepID=A0ABU5SKV2_9BACT|nr:(2Fe-2S)-binding protein [Arcicella sp. DC25W]MEA5427898.1 (2Fe-2S)-binding protein [Arcicella sp. DC25W]